jgi:hypothetical protein
MRDEIRAVAGTPAVLRIGDDHCSAAEL